ncbi:hypothetical protein NQ315_007116 [Exocentrus adspersus]|uniref:Probable ATP-dependent RNA helicase spindle-E n=1 Tax=Exocentrus adspersus TaxID=1586481 RepID=A0AAV8WCI9_9CUCU|nr:hypothetical protein NQ315_007116 [Exocentrus adspersus]
MNKLLAIYDQKPTVPTATVDGVTSNISDDDYSSSDSEKEPDHLEYEEEFVRQEMGRYAQHSGKVGHKKSGGLCDVEGVEGVDFKNNAFDIYENYDFTKPVKKELPIDSFKQKILNLIEVNNVVIIQGPTGCGKTTQVPQYILDDQREKRAYCNIAVTQPRKIATINVARRVCQERQWTLGTVCGYQIGLERKISPNVILTYMTTGVLLQKIIHDKHLNQFTHIVIDEVHERNQELDFLLLIVRKFLFTNSPKVKVILMSATIEAHEFANYFRSQNFTTPLPAPIIYVDKKSTYSKTVFYMEQLSAAISATKAQISEYDIEKPEICADLWLVFIFLVDIADNLDMTDATGQKIVGSVLEAKRQLELHFEKSRSKPQIVETDDGKSIEIIRPKWEIIPLHSSLPNDEQAKVFQPTTPGFRKIILSTNIAESSITVPDSYYVIDFCMTKVMTVDPITKYMSLKLEWASHVNCEQRAGRVGRIGDGRVYRLVPRSFYEGKMSKRSLPEILNSPLERIVLQAKALNLKHTPAQILALALNPPNLKNIQSTILTLKEMGALLQTCRGIMSNSDGDMTYLGKVMSKLPVDVRLSKLIVLGQLFSCLEETVIIAAGCSIQNIFSIPFQQKFNAYKKLLVWADGSASDLIALLNLYQVWRTCHRDNQFKNHQAEQTWCNLNLVSLKGLREWNLLVTELNTRLERMNIRETTGPAKILLSHIEKPLILKVITAGAFYPNFFIKEPVDVETKERDAVKTVGGRDPFKTVYFTGMDPYQPGPLYTKSIKQMLKSSDTNEQAIVVGFDGSSKIYIEFKSQEASETISVSMSGLQQVTNVVSGKIPYEVYEAIRKRQLQYNFSLDVLPISDAWKLAEQYGIKKNSTFQTITTAADMEERNCFTVEFNPIPTLDIQFVTIKVTEFIDASHFWANSLESEYYLGKIEKALNSEILHEVVNDAAASERVFKLGKIYAARYHADNLFYRCKIVAHSPTYMQILFIDYGNIQQVTPREIYKLPDVPECKLPPLSVECVIHGIQPSLKQNPKGVWSDSANNFCRKHVVGLLLYGEVHSVVDNVIYLKLFKNSPRRGLSKSLNQLMIESGYAEASIDSFLCKLDHEKRQAVINAENPVLEAARLSVEKAVNCRDFELPNKGYEKTLQLRGPFSPLEMRFHGCTESSTNKCVEIDGSSVNTVVLDNEPQSYQTSLLVAGYVGLTGNGTRLRLRQTTLLPNIPGLPMVLALLFCPTMRVKLTDDGTRVASILCGLGYNELTHKAFYPAHDIALVLDTELTESDVNKINQMRFFMSQGLKLMNDISERMVRENDIIGIQNSLKNGLMELMTPRQVIERIGVKYANVWWKSNVDAVVLKPNMCDDSEDVWPLLWFVKLNDIGLYGPTIRKNLDDLDSVARNMKAVPENFQCELCHEFLLFVYDVRFHIISDRHKEAVKDYYENIQKSITGDDDE